jgi:hypothetical protein
VLSPFNDPLVSSEYFVCIAITLSILAQSPFIMVFSVPIDVIIVHDFMMLVLSCHPHVLCPCIIRIALLLLLSSVAMFCIWAALPSLLFLFGVTLIVYRICQVDGINIALLDGSRMSLIVTARDQAKTWLSPHHVR